MNNEDLSIIIVDDQQFSRTVAKSTLTKAGYLTVRTAAGASEALTMLEQQPADVVLTDWMMPEMDGLELTQRIRQRDEKKGRYTAIILFTAHGGVEYLVKAFAQGADDYLSKPPNPLELSARINAAARIAALQNASLETTRQMQQHITSLKNTAMVDELTSAYNQKFFMRNLHAHLLEATTRRSGVCLMIIELRQLESITAEHGQFITNEILISHHQRLRRTIRPTDIVARIDHHVFGVIMHHEKIKNDTPTAMERMLATINHRAYKTTAGNLTLTGCIGTHYYRGDQAIISAEEMMKQAFNKLAAIP